MNNIREVLGRELEQRFPESLFKNEYRICRNKHLFEVFADDVIKAIPENVTLSVKDGALQFSRKETKPDAYSTLTDDDPLTEYLKGDQGPKNLDGLIKHGLQHSSLKHFLQ